MESAELPSLADAASYVADTCAELRRIAKHPALRTVSYLLDMARVEAERLAVQERRQGAPNGLNAKR